MATAFASIPHAEDRSVLAQDGLAPASALWTKLLSEGEHMNPLAWFRPIRKAVAAE